MIEWAEKECPGYKDARIKGKTKFLKKDQFNKLKELFQKEELKDLLTLGTVDLTRQATARNYRDNNDYLIKNRNRVKNEIAPFINANIKYGLSCLVDFLLNQMIMLI